MLIVAEIGGNHNGDLERALRLVEVAAASGADAVKLQTFKPEEMAVPYKINTGPWKDYDLTDLYLKTYPPWEWHEAIFKHANDLGIMAFSTPFSTQAVDFLETLNCPIYKIASFELVDLELIKYAANTGKPLIMSTGMAQTHEIRAAVQTAREGGCENLTLLHCVSQYPTTYEDTNLRTMSALSRFGCDIGLSDHSLGSVVPVMATTLGAKVIEKHLKLTQDEKGPDSGFSMDPYEFCDMVTQCRYAKTALGEIKFYSEGKENLRRSLYYAQDVPRGTKIEPHHIKTARPALGISPLRLNQVIGKTLNQDVKENDPVQTL